ncbi:MAG TPA: SRPBCC family protein [Marmoricola sp.]|nr:SRPBCC family protein [Marmoricola sp.]
MPLEANTLEASIDIAATPAQVWALVGDPRNMKRWSPQLVRSLGRGSEIAEGSKFFNINRKGAMVWPTQSMVIRYDPEREVAWRVKENWSIWALRLEPIEIDGKPGTRLSQFREAPKGISDLSVTLTSRFLGGVPKFTAELEDGMTTTLRRIKADIEG